MQIESVDGCVFTGKPSPPLFTVIQGNSSPKSSSSQQQCVLVVDDDPVVAATHGELLQSVGFQAVIANDPRDVLDLLRQRLDICLVLLDMRMPHISGLELLPRIKACRPELAVIAATVINDIEHAVMATKAGAYNYLLKPLQAGRLQDVINSCLSNVPVPLIDDNRFRSFITQEAAFVDIFKRIQSFASAEVPMLIEGETGTGKELIARLAHALSPRVEHDFLAINIAAISAELFESELFGHKKGSFTGAYKDKRGYFESASNATLFLDEIGELGGEQQKKLLRVLQSNTFFRVGDTKEIPTNVRLIFATNKNLTEEVAAGRFRADLYYRIASHSLALPPLRSRPKDISLLARYFLEKYSAQFGRGIRNFSDEALHILSCYNYPGNVRELEGIVSSAVLLEQSDCILPQSLPKHLLDQAMPAYSYATDERYVEIMQALSDSGGNQTLAAKKLGIARETLNRWLKKYQASSVNG